MNFISKKNSINHFFYTIIASVFLLAPTTVSGISIEEMTRSGISAEDHLSFIKYTHCTINGSRYIVPNSRQDIIRNRDYRCEGLFLSADGRGAYDAVSEVCASAAMWNAASLNGYSEYLRKWPQSYSANPSFGIRIRCGQGNSGNNGGVKDDYLKPKKQVYCLLGKSSFSYKPNVDYYVFRSYKLSENRRQLRRQYKVFGDYNSRSLQRAQKIQAEGKMEFIMKAPLRELCPHLKSNCNTAEPFVSNLCGKLDETGVLPRSAYDGQ